MSKVIKSEDLGQMPGFPMVDEVCPACRGTLKTITSYYGFSQREKCVCTNRETPGRHIRQMRDDEKERYMLYVIWRSVK